MYEEFRTRYSSTCVSLNRRISELNMQLGAAEKSKQLKEVYMSKRASQARTFDLCSYVLEATKPLLDETKKYLTEKKKNAMFNINNALRISSEIVPDAMSGAQFATDKGSATVVSPDGIPIQVLEGGGYRQVASALVRYVVLSATGYLQTMFLDEVFALLNDENSATLSVYLQIMCKNIQVISIEQKDSVYLNVDHTVYRLSKSEKYSLVERNDIHAG